LKTFHLLGGLPRSGSTLLAALLNQHPSIYVTTTSPLLDQIVANQDIWHGLQTVKANPVPDQLTNITRRMIDGMWSHINKPIIVDNNRGWGKNMITADILWDRPMKMVAVVRDLPSIMASWLTLIRKNPKNTIDLDLRQRGLVSNDANRMMLMWKEMVEDCVDGLGVALNTSPNNVMLVQYDSLVAEPEKELKRIEDFWGIESHKYNIRSVKSNEQDDMAAWGMEGMHAVRSKVSKESKDPVEILGAELFNMYSDMGRQIFFKKGISNAN